jgi:hypothetical protein
VKRKSKSISKKALSYNVCHFSCKLVFLYIKNWKHAPSEVVFFCLETGHVTDKETRVCVDPRGNDATMNMGEGGGPGLPGWGRNEQLVPSSGGRQTFIGCYKT